MGKSNNKEPSMSQQDIQKLIDRLTDAERKLAQLDATTAPVQRIGQLETTLSEIKSNTTTNGREIEALRKKQGEDMEKAIEGNKPDMKVMIAGGSLVLTMFLGLATFVNSGDSSNASSIKEMKATLMGEVLEAKNAAKSAGAKFGPLDEKIETLQQRMPSESEWMTAEREIDEIYGIKRQLLQRVTESEGKIERSLMLIDKSEQAWKTETANINRGMEVVAGRLNSNESVLSSTKAAITGMATEVEAQMRGMNTYVNTEFASIKQKVAMNWHEAHGSPMPPNAFYSEQIPAKATISIGEVPNGQ